MNAIQLEYSCLLSRQLEDQRLYFEGKIKEMEDRFLDYKEASTDKVGFILIVFLLIFYV